MDLNPDLDSLPQPLRASMLAAGREIRECYRVLEKADLNIVGEVLRGQGDFVEMAHYPSDDVFDRETCGQYYYHAHRVGEMEHGHFHIFLRAGGMPDGSAPVDRPLSGQSWPSGDDAICHLIALSMDAWGYPIGLFCTNRWVTDEAWYPAQQVIAMLDRFAIDHAFPNWCVNRWLGAMLRLYRPHIEALIRQRDAVLAQWQTQHPGTDIFENRALEMCCYLPIAVDPLIAALEKIDAGA